MDPIDELQKWKAEQWDKLVENITYEPCDRRFVIYDEICSRFDIQLRKE